MKAFMTTGTTHFLKELTEKHPAYAFHFMKANSGTLVYYEAEEKKSLFVSGRSYDIKLTAGTIQKTGFVVMHHIPVSEEEIPVFEERMKKQLTALRQMTGVLAVRLLQEQRSNSFVILVQWEKEKYYHQWQKSDSAKQTDFAKHAKLPAYFMERPFTNQYYMLKEEENE